MWAGLPSIYRHNSPPASMPIVVSQPIPASTSLQDSVPQPTPLHAITSEIPSALDLNLHLTFTASTLMLFLLCLGIRHGRGWLLFVHRVFLCIWSILQVHLHLFRPGPSVEESIDIGSIHGPNDVAVDALDQVAQTPAA